jgi:nitroreductase/catechol 2,3-dioxygenase-like lactoylglutathione lyase family enzyme
MSGLIFLPTSDLRTTLSFYKSKLGMELWLDQGDCAVLQHGNLLLGFCERSGESFNGIITLFYETREEVDAIYQNLRDIAEGAPKGTEAYKIYHFFARDPEDRKIEFQTFLHELRPHLSGRDLLITRRSIRKFKGQSVPEEVILQIIDLCRYAPSSRNSQGVTYTAIRDRELQDFVASIRGSSSSPIAAAPLAVAISADPQITGRPEQDACIAAYHITLAARLHGLGTCWIGGLDRDEVKLRLGLPKEHYLATVTPLGYPTEQPEIRLRKPVESYVSFINSAVNPGQGEW